MNDDVQSRELWLAERRTGLGGSDAAAALGVSKWKTPLQLYLEKIGEYEVTQNDAMEWGNRLEPVVRQKYCDVTGRSVTIPNKILRHSQYEWMLANVDGIAELDRLLEIKTSRSAEGWGDVGTDEIPDDYRLQIQHYLTVTNLPVADVAVLIGNSDFRIYEVEHDDDLANMLISGEAEFWLRVLNRDPPEPSGTEDCKLRWPQSRGSFADATDEQRETVLKIKELKELVKKAEQDIEIMQGQVMAAIGERDGLQFGGKPLVTWKSAKPAERLDVASLRAAWPDLCAEFMRTDKPSRRFLVK